MSEMCDISNEIKDEPHTDNKEVYILPDREVSETEIKQEDMELADAEHMNKEAHGVDQKLNTNTVPEAAHDCHECEKSFSRNSSLKRHIETMHKGSKTFICAVCDKPFSQKCHLTQHIETIHEGKRPHQCNICGKSFSQKHHLNTHVATVHQGSIN